MLRISTKSLKTAYGELILGSYKEQLCLCDWKYRKMRATVDNRIKEELNSDFIEEDAPLLEHTSKQLQEYFDNKRKEFDIPLLMLGTEFQKKIWNLLIGIPFGETETYLGLAKRINNVEAIRAVASANGANAISILVPCHRVIGSDGSLTGYAGGLQTKKKLLQLESKERYPEQLTFFE